MRSLRQSLIYKIEYMYSGIVCRLRYVNCTVKTFQLIYNKQPVHTMYTDKTSHGVWQFVYLRVFLFEYVFYLHKYTQKISSYFSC